jgi:hypothetical protein
MRQHRCQGERARGEQIADRHPQRREAAPKPALAGGDDQRAAKRWQGFLDATLEAGLEPPRRLVHGRNANANANANAGVAAAAEMGDCDAISRPATRWGSACCSACDRPGGTYRSMSLSSVSAIWKPDAWSAQT